MCKTSMPMNELDQIGSAQRKEYVCRDKADCRQRHYHNILGEE